MSSPRTRRIVTALTAALTAAAIVAPHPATGRATSSTSTPGSTPLDGAAERATVTMTFRLGGGAKADAVGRLVAQLWSWDARVELVGAQLTVSLTDLDPPTAKGLQQPSSSIALHPVLSCSEPGSPGPGASSTVPAPDAPRLLPLRAGGRCLVGPAAKVDGPTFASDGIDVSDLNAVAVITADLTASGNQVFNELAEACYRRDASCPSGQLGLAVGGELVTAPTVNEPRFDKTVQISGNFSQSEARGIAATLWAANLPSWITLEKVDVGP